MEPFTKEILAAPEWAPYRRSVIRVKGKICVHCGEIADYPFVQPIHYIQGRMPWDYEANEMQISCPMCHYAAQDRSHELFDLLDKFNFEEQQAVVDALQIISETPAPGRQIGAERLAYFIGHYLAPDLPVANNNPIDVLAEKKKRLKAVLSSCDVSTIDPLSDALDALAKFPLSQRRLLLEKIRTLMEDPEGNDLAASSTNGFKSLGSELRE